MRPLAMALVRVRTSASCPIMSAKVAGRYLRASTRYGVAVAGASVMSGPMGSGRRPDNDPRGNSLRLLPSGPDRVGETHVRRRPPGDNIGPGRHGCKAESAPASALRASFARQLCASALRQGPLGDLPTTQWRACRLPPARRAINFEAMQESNFYVTATLDRAALRRRDDEWLLSRRSHPQSRLLPVWRGQNLIRDAEVPVAALLTLVEAQTLIAEGGTVAFLGLIGEAAHFAIDLSHREEPPILPGTRFADLRSVGALLAREEGGLLAYARGLLHWHQRHRFCGVCGSPTEPREGGHLRRCTSCGTEHYPRTDPAVIMRIA